MQIALLILRQMLKLFIMLLLGWGIVKTKLLKSNDSKVLSTIAVYLVTPCVIINAFQIESTPEAAQGLLLAFGAAICSQLIFLTLICTVGKKLPVVERASIMYSNAANMIIPIVQAVLGAEWVLYTSAYIAVQIVLLWTHGRSMISGEKGISLKKIFTNLNIISMFIGILLFAFDLKLPALAAETMNSISAMVGPLGMLILGMLMADLNLKEVLKNKRIYLISAIRLLICPLLVLLLIKVSGVYNLRADAATILFIPFLASCAPPAVNITQMAQVYGENAKHASAINVFSICMCLFTTPLLAGLYWTLIG